MLYYQGDRSLFFFGFETQTIDDEWILRGASANK